MRDGAILFKLIEKYKIEGHGIDISENAKSIATEYMIKTGIKFKYVIGDVQNYLTLKIHLIQLFH